MRLSKAMLGLPPSLLLLLAMQLSGGSASAAQGQAIQQQQQKRSLLPTAIKKMSLDEGEKFMPEYYAFAPEPSFAEAQSSPDSSTFWARSLALTPEEEALLALNSSATIRYRPPFPRHYDYRRAVGADADADVSSGGRRFLYRRARDALARLQGRQFSCPDNTASCDNIDQPNYCCVEGTTCFVVTDSPEAGNVGCCPEGQNCGGSVGTCTDDSTACPADVGGGCCVSGFVCAEVGCVASSVSVITSTTVTSTVVTSPTPTTQVITVVVTVTPSATPATSTVTRTTTAAGASTSSTGTITTTTTTAAGIPPVRPTSSGSGSQTSLSSPTTTTITSSPTDPGYCPTGFYACLASAGAGCCRTGRDCSTTSCPPPPAMTTYTANGVTVAVPAGDASAASAAGPDAAPTCAGGWFMCGADAGPVPGCCPDGYVCGTASCTLSAAAAETATVQKEMPGGGAAAGTGMGSVTGYDSYDGSSEGNT
ncbi:hypothetical protein F4809DRAFT_657432 [Biscogniauxia mediterranea]|nr:hypothetical protein F4809DRAFT_657432 [Biscogniauxia mediterranea]